MGVVERQKPRSAQGLRVLAARSAQRRKILNIFEAPNKAVDCCPAPAWEDVGGAENRLVCKAFWAVRGLRVGSAYVVGLELGEANAAGGCAGEWNLVHP